MDYSAIRIEDREREKLSPDNPVSQNESLPSCWQNNLLCNGLKISGFPDSFVAQSWLWKLNWSIGSVNPTVLGLQRKKSHLVKKRQLRGKVSSLLSLMEMWCWDPLTFRGKSSESNRG
jgi:hypothetical protein